MQHWGYGMPGDLERVFVVRAVVFVMIVRIMVATKARKCAWMSSENTALRTSRTGGSLVGLGECRRVSFVVV